MVMTQAEFDRLEAEWKSGGAVAAVAELVSQLKEQQQYHELFEALKMQARIGLGLSPMPSGEEEDQNTYSVFQNEWFRSELCIPLIQCFKTKLFCS